MDIFSNIDFLKHYDAYKIDNKDNIYNLITYLKSLSINTQYYNKKNTKYYNNTDENIKTIHNFLNKCSTCNIEKIQKQIYDLLNKDIVIQILETIIDKCIDEPGYIDLYIQIIQNIKNKYESDISTIIDKFIENIYIDKKYSNDYDGLCEYNRSSDKCIAFSILISKLEKKQLIKNYTKSIIEKCFDKINLNNDDITFKYIGCLFKIFESNPLSINIFDGHLIELQKNIKCKKTLFKITDIFDLKK